MSKNSLGGVSRYYRKCIVWLWFFSSLPFSTGMLLLQVTVVFIWNNMFFIYITGSHFKRGKMVFLEIQVFWLNIIFSSWFDLPLYIIPTMIFSFEKNNFSFETWQWNRNDFFRHGWEKEVFLHIWLCYVVFFLNLMCFWILVFVIREVVLLNHNKFIKINL